MLRAGALGWSDVGSWDEVYRLSEKDLENNVLIGSNVIARNSRGCLADLTQRPIIVTYGMSDAIIINTGDAILITQAATKRRDPRCGRLFEAQADDRVLVIGFFGWYCCPR